MPTTYEPIATQTLGSAAATITFSSIPATYTDLKFVLVPSTGTADANVFMQLNSDTGTNYSNTRLVGNGSTASSARQTNTSSILVGAITNTKNTFFSYDFFSYAGSTFKTILIEQNEDLNGSGSVIRRVGLWRSTSAITSIFFDTFTTGGFPVGTTATLYGIKNA